MGKSGIVFPQNTGLFDTFSSYEHFRQLDHCLAGKIATEIKITACTVRETIESSMDNC